MQAHGDLARRLIRTELPARSRPADWAQSSGGRAFGVQHGACPRTNSAADTRVCTRVFVLSSTSPFMICQVLSIAAPYPFLIHKRGAH